MFSPKITTTCLIGVIVGSHSAGSLCNGCASAVVAAEPVTTASTAADAIAPTPYILLRRLVSTGFSS